MHLSYSPLSHTGWTTSSIYCPSYTPFISFTSSTSKPSTIVQEWVTRPAQPLTYTISTPSTILQELITSVQPSINTSFIHEWVTPPLNSHTILVSSHSLFNMTLIPFSTSTFHYSTPSIYSSSNVIFDITSSPTYTMTPLVNSSINTTSHYSTPLVYSASNIIFDITSSPTYIMTPLVNSPSSILINTTSKWMNTSMVIDCTRVRNCTSNLESFINATATIPTQQWAVTMEPWRVTTSDGLQIPIGYRCYLLLYLIWSLFLL